MKKVLTTLAVAVSGLIAVSTAQAQADTGATIWKATQVGALESPPNDSPGSGTALIDLRDGTMLVVDEQFKDLTGVTTEAHIHCCTSSAFSGTAGVAVPFTDFVQNVTTGTYLNAFDLTQDTTFDSGFLSSNGGAASSASSALMAGIAANEAYVNIHTTTHPDGEIRGWLVAAPIPEPATWAMLGIGLVGLGFMSRRKV
jgi:hypothetical protein